MRKHIILYCLLFLVCNLSWGQNHIVITPAGEMERAVSGHFAGIVDGKLRTWGGCNFPDVPCAEGGKKVFDPVIAEKIKAMQTPRAVFPLALKPIHS